MNYPKRLKNTLVYLTVLTGLICFPKDCAALTVQKKDSAYLWLLKECNQEVFTKTFEYPFLALLAEDLKKEYKEMKGLEQKKAYITYYWKKHNPDPLMDKNEYLQNFIKRYDYVKENFPSPKPPYFDDRGKYYLKYGEPTTRVTQGPQTKWAHLFRDERVREFIGSVLFPWKLGKPSVPAYYSIEGNETWVYQFQHGDQESELVLHFVKEGKFFREVESLDQAIIYPRRTKLRYFYWADLLKERANKAQSQSLFRAYEDIWSFEDDINIVVNGGNVISSKHDVYHPHLKLINIDNKLRVDLKDKKFDTPATVFTPDKAVQKLLFHYDIVQFKGSGEATTLAINYFTPLSDNLIQDNEFPEPDSLRLAYGCLFENQKLQQVVKSGYEKSYHIQQLSQLDLPYLIGNMSISLLPREGRITLQVKDEETQRSGFVKRNILIRDFSTQKLCISDIQFCQEVTDPLYRNFAPVRQLRGIRAIPYPFEYIKKSEQLFCYFEIYNIKTSGIQSQYEVALEVTKGGKNQKAVRRKSGNITKSSPHSITLHHTRAVEQNDSKELIGLDFSNLKKGYYTLTIRVTDQDDPGIFAEVSRNIQIKR